MNILRTMMGLVFAVGLSMSAHAQTLWDNGNHLDDQLLGNYYRILDDFYVPGAGWWIDKAEVYGMFFNATYYKHQKAVEVVNIRIMAADPVTGEPDPSFGTGLVVTSFDEEPIDSLRTRVEANFEKVFLKGQRRYWIEFEIINNYDYYMRGLASASSAFLPAYGNHQTGAQNQMHETDGDLAFSLFGQPIRTVGYAASDDFKVKSLDPGHDTWTLDLVGEHPVFKPGLYQMQMSRRSPVLYRIDEDGKQIVDFKVDDGDSGHTEFSTPLGDDMCGEAPDILQSFCQDFVACAAYTFCGSIPIP